MGGKEQVQLDCSIAGSAAASGRKALLSLFSRALGCWLCCGASPKVSLHRLRVVSLPSAAREFRSF